jgi:hypothetical protein
MKDLFPISVFTIIVLFSIYQNFRIWDKVADDNQFTHQVIIENKKLIKQLIIEQKELIKTVNTWKCNSDSGEGHAATRA